MYVYIHGFNSGASSRSGKMLAEVLGVPVFCPAYDYSRPFEQCWQSLIEQIMDAAREEDITLLGSSLGGFYAMQLRLPNIRRVMAWNPVIFPAIQLAPFLGRNTRFSDGMEWDFDADILYSYAKAPDAREWLNHYGRSLVCDTPRPPRVVILGASDEVLDMRLAWHYWQGSARLACIPSGHRIDDYRHVLDFLD